MTEVTRYFRNAVAVSAQGAIDFKKAKFFEISREELNQGKLTEEMKEAMLKPVADKDDKAEDWIVALKTICLEYEDGASKDPKLEELEGVFFAPVKINKEGELAIPEKGKLPWVPREYLSPMEEPMIALGSAENYDRFLTNTAGERNRIETWDAYFTYAKKLYRAVTGAAFDSSVIPCGDGELKADDKYYIFRDGTVSATGAILNLYSDILKGHENKLYAGITNGTVEQSRPLHPNTDTALMQRHTGQMGGAYPLSPSQREAIHHFNLLGEGEVLAVSGPPGTGKTTLLQSVVANMYVDRALNAEDAPVIVAASTNNQAVTNIIDSFGNIAGIGLGCLEERWITGVNSFAVYFPSMKKAKDAEDNHYQYMSIYGKRFLAKVEEDENRESSRNRFAEEYEKYFGVKEDKPKVWAETLHQALCSLDSERKECLSILEKIQKLTADRKYQDYLAELTEKMAQAQDSEQEIKTIRDQLSQKHQEYNESRQRFYQSYRNLPGVVRVFGILPVFRREIELWLKTFIGEEKAAFLRYDMTFDEAEAVYNQVIDQSLAELREFNEKMRGIKSDREFWMKQKEELLSAVETLKQKVRGFASFMAAPKDEEKFFADFDVCRVNDLLDRVRYAEFWLAVHYYEAMWLKDENPISENQMSATFENVLDKMYHRTAMLAPCMVMTFFMLPRQFSAYDSQGGNYKYLYNFIDLLIVNEAGQTSPEIAAASFALAKSAIVVGDEQQIPPVWGTMRALDIAMAKDNGVIHSGEEFENLEDNGLNCSQSSIMKVASLSCPFDKYGSKGLFLSEHRRCYDEIIAYCNELVYSGNLEPMRGSAVGSGNALQGYLPAMGHKQISAEQSERKNSSRCNQKEAEEIARWVKANLPKLIACYGGSAERELLGVITPFTQQKYLIEKMLKRELPTQWQSIAVGTVHAFQGAERKVIIFSTVYGKRDGCPFIENNSNLMNVAVSRAKDAFLVFGERGCLSDDKSRASGLLKAMTTEEIE